MAGYDVINLYRRADLREDHQLVFSVLERKCAYKEVPVPTLEAVAESEKAMELRADWEAMLAHQLPTLPPGARPHTRERSGEVRAYRVDRIEGVRVTDRTFIPRYAIELSAALPVRTGRRGPRPGSRRPRSGRRGR